MSATGPDASAYAKRSGVYAGVVSKRHPTAGRLVGALGRIGSAPWTSRWSGRPLAFGGLALRAVACRSGGAQAPATPPRSASTSPWSASTPASAATTSLGSGIVIDGGAGSCSPPRTRSGARGRSSSRPRSASCTAGSSPAPRATTSRCCRSRPRIPGLATLPAAPARLAGAGQLLRSLGRRRTRTGARSDGAAPRASPVGDGRTAPIVRRLPAAARGDPARLAAGARGLGRPGRRQRRPPRRHGPGRPAASGACRGREIRARLRELKPGARSVYVGWANQYRCVGAPARLRAGDASRLPRARRAPQRAGGGRRGCPARKGWMADGGDRGGHGRRQRPAALGVIVAGARDAASCSSRPRRSCCSRATIRSRSTADAAARRHAADRRRRRRARPSGSPAAATTASSALDARDAEDAPRRCTRPGSRRCGSPSATARCGPPTPATTPSPGSIPLLPGSGRRIPIGADAVDVAVSARRRVGDQRPARDGDAHRPDLQPRARRAGPHRQLPDGAGRRRELRVGRQLRRRHRRADRPARERRARAPAAGRPRPAGRRRRPRLGVGRQPRRRHRHAAVGDAPAARRARRCPSAAPRARSRSRARACSCSTRRQRRVQAIDPRTGAVSTRHAGRRLPDLDRGRARERRGWSTRAAGRSRA